MKEAAVSLPIRKKISLLSPPQPQAAQPFLLRPVLNNSIKSIFASFFDGFHLVESARAQIRIMLDMGSLC